MHLVLLLARALLPEVYFVQLVPVYLLTPPVVATHLLEELSKATP
jgi:hypothetical protein